MEGENGYLIDMANIDKVWVDTAAIEVPALTTEEWRKRLQLKDHWSHKKGNELVNTSLFDPLIPYIQTIAWDKKEFYVEFIWPENLLVNTNELEKYFKDWQLKFANRKVVRGFFGEAFGPMEPGEIKGTLISNDIGLYLLSKM